MQDRVPPQNIEADSDLKSLQMYFRINYATLPGCLKILGGLIFILGNSPAIFVQPAQSIKSAGMILRCCFAIPVRSFFIIQFYAAPVLIHPAKFILSFSMVL